MAEQVIGESYLEVEAQLGGTFLHPGGRDLTRWLLQSLADEPPPRQTLEIGCGAAGTAALVAEMADTQVVALERSAAMLVAARQRLSSAGAGKAWLVQADGNRPLPFAVAAFDSAYAESVVALLEIRKVFAELHRVLRPGGLLILNERIWKPGLTRQQVAKVNDASRRAFAIPAATPEPWDRDDWLGLLQTAGFVQVSAIAVDDLLVQRAPAWHIDQRAARLRRYLARPVLVTRALRFKVDARRQAELWARMECFVFVARKPV